LSRVAGGGASPGSPPIPGSLIHQGHDAIGPQQPGASDARRGVASPGSSGSELQGEFRSTLALGQSAGSGGGVVARLRSAAGIAHPGPRPASGGRGRWPLTATELPSAVKQSLRRAVRRQRKQPTSREPWRIPGPVRLAPIGQDRVPRHPRLRRPQRSVLPLSNPSAPRRGFSPHRRARQQKVAIGVSVEARPASRRGC